MLLYSWLQWFCPYSRTSKTRRAPRLHLEPLESREVPANFAAASVSDLIADINAANLNAEADTITLVPGTTFTLTALDNTTDGPNALPVVTASENLTIVGNGDIIERSTETGTRALRLFDVAAGASLTLQNLTLQGGLAFGSLYGYPGAGGAIFSRGALTIDGCTIQNNTAYGGYGGSAYGGGVCVVRGTASISNSILTANIAEGGPGLRGEDAYSGGINGGADGTDGGPGGDGLGGGLYVAGGSVTLHGISVTKNVAKGGDGGQGGSGAPRGFKRGHDGKPGNGIGGGIYVAPQAAFALDAFTLEHVLHNKATTSDDNIFGTYDLIA